MFLKTEFKQPMTLDKAAELLNLPKNSPPASIDKKVKTLIQGISSESEKKFEIIAASSFLKQAFKTELSDIADVSGVNGDFDIQLHITSDMFSDEEIENILETGKALKRLTKEYSTQFQAEGSDIYQLTHHYQRQFRSAISDMADKISPENRHSAMAVLQTLKSKQLIAHSLVLFKLKFDSYLDNIQKIIDTEQSELPGDQNAQQPMLTTLRYNQALQDLQKNLRSIGGQFFIDIKDESADEAAVIAKFNRDFNSSVESARHAFAKQPGIWANLNCILKMLAIILCCIPAIMIICAEKPEDRHRLFRGAPKGELNMDEIWKNLEMDELPDPSKDNLNQPNNV